ncbi:MAG: ferritin [Calditrichaeota bacterium]|nr:MAG: ferritin [Calditrichota bacterium]MBL1205564.1 ferritin [Calditrichota bacterium]NOG45393.1 ferritin [Calditrichota bacterium]
MLSEKMLIALNNQIRDEFYSEYFYLSMSAWCDSNDLPGMASFMKLKGEEERVHGMKIYDYIHDRDGKVTLLGIEQPPSEFESFLDIFEKQLEHEKKVTALIHNLYALALEEKDYATSVMLQWFIEEQVEEEKEASEIIQQCKQVGDSQSALFMLDQKLGALTPGLGEE